MDCPKCGDECWRDSADVGVGYIYGPWGCPTCGWSEDSELDRTNPQRLPSVRDGYWHDQFGGVWPVESIIENAGRFGQKMAEEVRKAFQEQK